jgi:hypothetical protein
VSKAQLYENRSKVMNTYNSIKDGSSELRAELRPELGAEARAKT